MKTIIPPLDKQLLVAELNKDRFLRNTNNGNNEIYLVTNNDSPNVVREIGRLREVTFRDAGGGTGKELDIDSYDKGEHAFKQLVLWDPQEEEIIGGYRYIHCMDLEVSTNGAIKSPTAKLFKYSEKFIKEYFPHTIELGRSFVQPLYQPTFNLRRGMYALDNLWDGIGAVIVDNASVKYMFGKVTMYPEFDTLARDMILFFLHKYFPDNDRLIYPVDPLLIGTSDKILNSIFAGCNYEEDYKTLIQKVRKLGENVPPLVNAYMNLSATMKTFGTAVNHNFGDVEETGILLTVKDIFAVKKDRHLTSYQKTK
ncbi:MAG: GNAT family N-acetyltransferase [Bacteroidota bacterium]